MKSNICNNKQYYILQVN